MRNFAFLSVFLLLGCAGTVIEPVNPANESKSTGIRYYEPAPFLLVYSDARGNLNSEILILPDLTRMRSVDPFSYLSTNNTTLTFSNGLLTQGKAVVDETVIPAKIFEGLKSVAGTLVNAAFDAKDEFPSIPAPRLFRIHVNNKGHAFLVDGDTVGADDKPIEIQIKFTSQNADGGS